MRMPQKTFADAATAGVAGYSLHTVWTQALEPALQALILVATFVLVVIRAALAVREWVRGRAGRRPAQGR